MLTLGVPSQGLSIQAIGSMSRPHYVSSPPTLSRLSNSTSQDPNFLTTGFFVLSCTPSKFKTQPPTASAAEAHRNSKQLPAIPCRSATRRPLRQRLNFPLTRIRSALQPSRGGRRCGLISLSFWWSARLSPSALFRSSRR